MGNAEHMGMLMLMLMLPLWMMKVITMVPMIMIMTMMLNLNLNLNFLLLRKFVIQILLLMIPLGIIIMNLLVSHPQLQLLEMVIMMTTTTTTNKSPYHFKKYSRYFLFAIMTLPRPPTIITTKLYKRKGDRFYSMISPSLSTISTMVEVDEEQGKK